MQLFTARAGDWASLGEQQGTFGLCLLDAGLAPSLTLRSSCFACSRGRIRLRALTAFLALLPRQVGMVLFI